MSCVISDTMTNPIILSPEEQMLLASQQLKELYNEYYPFLLEFLRKGNLFNRQISFPLLIKPFPAYFTSDVRLMIAGQETQGWSMSKNLPYIKDEINIDRVHSLLMLYKNVGLGKERQSPFWRFARELNKRFNSSHEAFIWNNISKVDERGTTPKWDIFHGSSATSSHSIINQEFEILKPNVVVFTTGANHDNCLRAVFKGIREEPVNEYISKLTHKLLPKNSYKTEHPLRLSMNRHFNKVIDFISADVKSSGIIGKSI